MHIPILSWFSNRKIHNLADKYTLYSENVDQFPKEVLQMNKTLGKNPKLFLKVLNAVTDINQNRAGISTEKAALGLEYKKHQVLYELAPDHYIKQYDLPDVPVLRHVGVNTLAFGLATDYLRKHGYQIKYLGIRDNYGGTSDIAARQGNQWVCIDIEKVDAHQHEDHYRRRDTSKLHSLAKAAVNSSDVETVRFDIVEVLLNDDVFIPPSLRILQGWFTATLRGKVK
jgi:Holliday junction resolvase-like predicted endonuclease